jgi:putative endonuclease
MSTSYKLGIRGEQIAVDLLIKKGYKILERNYRYRKSEVDIICQIGYDLVFVEVKTRSTEYFGTLSDSVDSKKIMMLSVAADHYVKESELDLEVRFDTISIVLNETVHEIQHIEHAFYPFNDF